MHEWTSMGRVLTRKSVIFLAILVILTVTNLLLFHGAWPPSLKEKSTGVKWELRVGPSRHLASCNVHRILGNLPQLNADLRSCQRVFYNRVPKCASRALLVVFKALSTQNNFTFVTTTISKRYHLTNYTEVSKFVNEFDTIKEPFFYSKHVNYVNFTMFGQISPVYINVVRDPIERAISHYYYKIYGSLSNPHQANNTKVLTFDECLARDGFEESPCSYVMDIVLRFFCGHLTMCKPGRGDLLNRAKRVVREQYLVVGVVEELESFLEILETLMPHYFQNATSVYRATHNTSMAKYRTVKRNNLLPATRERLKRLMAEEYEFYNFVKQRLHIQLTKVRLLRQSRGVGQLILDATPAADSSDASWM